MSDKVNINLELHRCRSYLRDRETQLPSHLKQTDMSVLSTQAQIKLLSEKLKDIETEEQKVKDAEDKFIASSLKEVTKVKDILYSTREKLQTLQTSGKIHHTHRKLCDEYVNSISREMRNYTPAKKSKS